MLAFKETNRIRITVVNRPNSYQFSTKVAQAIKSRPGDRLVVSFFRSYIAFRVNAKNKALKLFHFFLSLSLISSPIGVHPPALNSSKVAPYLSRTTITFLTGCFFFTAYFLQKQLLYPVRRATVVQRLPVSRLGNRWARGGSHWAANASLHARCQSRSNYRWRLTSVFQRV